jgi:hypothetical protein
MEKRKIINISLVVCIVIGIFFTIKFDLVTKTEDKIYQQKIKSEISLKANDKCFGEPISITEAFIDEEGNEAELAEEAELELNLINSDRNEGTLVNIEYNKLYFMVNKEVRELPYLSEDVEDYEVVFDIGTFNFKEGSYYDALEYLGQGKKMVANVFIVQVNWTFWWATI